MLSFVDMKFIVLVFVLGGLLFFGVFNQQAKSNVEATQEGMNFLPISFEEAIAKSKKEQKILFIDTYATWCGPCKKMDAQTFTNPDVQALFNKKFVNLRVDMGQPEGAIVSQKFSISSIPTLIFLKPDGKIAMVLEGYHSPEQLLAFAKEVISSNQNNIGK